jgi:hypothetical protein
MISNNCIQGCCVWQYIRIYVVILCGFWMRRINFRALKYFHSLCSTGNNAYIYHANVLCTIPQTFYEETCFFNNLYKVHWELNFRFTSCEMKRSVISCLRIFILQHPNYIYMYVYMYVCVCVHTYIHVLFRIPCVGSLTKQTERFKSYLFLIYVAQVYFNSDTNNTTKFTVEHFCVAWTHSGCHCRVLQGHIAAFKQL